MMSQADQSERQWFGQPVKPANQPTPSDGLRERIARALFESGNERLRTPDRDWNLCADDYRKDADRVIAAMREWLLAPETLRPLAQALLEKS
jgi:hypothetical protein